MEDNIQSDHRTKRQKCADLQRCVYDKEGAGALGDVWVVSRAGLGPLSQKHLRLPSVLGDRCLTFLAESTICIEGIVFVAL
jgi:hypothetical protein